MRSDIVKYSHSLITTSHSLYIFFHIPTSFYLPIILYIISHTLSIVSHSMLTFHNPFIVSIHSLKLLYSHLSFHFVILLLYTFYLIFPTLFVYNTCHLHKTYLILSILTPFNHTMHIFSFHYHLSFQIPSNHLKYITTHHQNPIFAF